MRFPSLAGGWLYPLAVAIILLAIQLFGPKIENVENKYFQERKYCMQYGSEAG